MTAHGEMMEEKDVFEVMLANSEDTIAELCEWERNHIELLDTERAIRRYAFDKQGNKNLPALTPTVSDDGQLSYAWKRNPTDPPLLNWGNWLAMAQVELWEACALSFAVNPDTIALKPRMTSTGRGASYSMELLPSRVSQAEFHERYTKLHGCVAKSDPHFKKFTRQMLAGRYIATVSLTEFAEWALDTELGDLPTELVSLADENFSMDPIENTEPTTSESVKTDGDDVDANDQFTVAPEECNTELDTNSPRPLTTGDMAFCFEGLLCESEDDWKVLFGKGRKWIEACCAVSGTRGRGGAPKLWNPVLLGAVIVRKKDIPKLSVRARFQTKPQLTEWLDQWKSHEVEYLYDY
jgi:hypothetical protein